MMTGLTGQMLVEKKDVHVEEVLRPGEPLTPMPVASLPEQPEPGSIRPTLQLPNHLP